MRDLSINIGWLYPDLMSTYGDQGNIAVLRKRCEWRNIQTNIISIDTTISEKTLSSVDIFFGGGAQDIQQELVMRDLGGKKAKIMKNKIELGTPALFVCGAPQLMGRYYEPSEGKKIEGLGIFDILTKRAASNKPRLVGNVLAEVAWENFDYKFNQKTLIVGFENHGGRTTLGKSAKPFAHIIRGNGNNGEDNTEGVIYKNAVGCYFHGPLLPKNPTISDWFIKLSLLMKYNKEITLSILDDTLEEKAYQVIASRIMRGI